MSSRSTRYAARDAAREARLAASEARRLEALRPSKEETRDYITLVRPIADQTGEAVPYSLERINCFVAAFEGAMTSRKIPAYYGKLRDALVETIEHGWTQVQPLSEDVRERIYDLRVRVHAFVASLVAEPCYR